LPCILLTGTLILAKVDPFQLPIPKGLEPEVDNYLRNLDMFLKDMWTRTGGGDDLIENANVLSARAMNNHSHPISDVDNFHFGVGIPEQKIGNDGDFYFRSDGALNTRIYHRGAGAWTAIT